MNEVSYGTILAKMAKVVIYSKDYCPYCDQAKRLLKLRDIPFEEINIGQWSMDAVNKLTERSGMRTVPQIFHGDELIGGCDELVAKDQRESGLDSLKSAQ